MKQKTRFKNFGNIRYQSTNSQYIGIAPKNPSVNLYSKVLQQSVATEPSLTCKPINKIQLYFKSTQNETKNLDTHFT